MNELNNELYHYGVLGMKWGVRHDRVSETFGKSAKHLDKLKDRHKKTGYAVQKYQSKAMRRRVHNIGMNMFFDDYNDSAIGFLRNNQERRASKDAALMMDKYRKQARDIRRFEKQMKKTFANVKMKDISPEDLALGRNYIDMLIGKKGISTNPYYKDPNKSKKKKK